MSIRKGVFGLMEMMHKGCRCVHHVVAMIFGVLASVAAVGFFVVIFSKATLFGWSADVYFMSAIMLVIIARGTKMCRCCRGHGMGYKCTDCGPQGEAPKMGM